MKNILGLDLGTTSIGWAFVKEGENGEQSTIEKIGVRVNPLTTDEQTNFEKGKPVSVNADRTLKRSARRNLQRYKLRRENLMEALKDAKIIFDETVLTETGKNTTHTTYQLRAKAAMDKIEKGELARVFLAINKKRGYKSSRKAKNEDEGQAIDGMAVAKRLYEENLTPGQLAYQLLKEGKKDIPDFYRSDLQAEFDKIWNCQKQFYPEIFTDEFYKELQGKGQRATAASFWGKYKFNTAENKGTREEKKLHAYEWRSKAISEKLEKEEAAYVITEINNNLNNSSGYLGAISDRSKELFFNKQTVGQYLYKQLQNNPHTRLKNQVFYRQDYLDEFEAIWNCQQQFHPELTEELKTEIRDITIFYQRKLKSQKSRISFCEFESQQKIINGNKKTIGLKVAPKSSPLFQEFKIWQVLHNLKFVNKVTGEIQEFKNDDTIEIKQSLFDELNIKGNLNAAQVLDNLKYDKKEWSLSNYKQVEGNRTNLALFDAYFKILEIEDYGEIDWEGYKSVKEDSIKSIYDYFKFSPKVEFVLNEKVKSLDKYSANEIKHIVKILFESLGINGDILEFNAELSGKTFEQQASYQLWHLLHSYEGDNSNSGNEKLYELLEKKFSFKKEHAKVLANVALSDDYGNLSAKAMRRIYPFIKENKYSVACELTGYRHSAASLTKEEIENRKLQPRLELLKKNSLRNPVVEKILNQMINVVNALIDAENKKRKAQGLPEDFHFDEIRIELARELKKNAKERAEMTTNINAAKLLHEKIIKLLQDEFGVKNPTRNDIIRYKLYEELKNNGYKDIYTDKYIPREKLFTKEIDIEHIIPQSKLFDDSFSNKTVVFRQTNLDKGNQTACDYIENKFGEEKLQEYKDRVEMLYKQKEGAISKAKYQKLLKKESEIGEGFIERDLRDSQYIAKKAKDMLLEISKYVVSTSGQITDRLREDWNLVNVMQELNFDKFKKLGLTEQVEKKDGTFKERIVDWSKRNDHRHHAMDALTIAFTKRSLIQYLNHLNARKNETDKFHVAIKGIEGKETFVVTDDEGNRKRVFKEPIPNFRQIAKEHLENVLVSHKAKNKVATKNKNKIKTAKGEKVKTILTPRGQLHKETVYGKIKTAVVSEEKIGNKFDEATINNVTNPVFKCLLLQRLQENGNDPKKAFGGNNALAKNPIYLDEAKTQSLPEKIKIVRYEDDYTIRKDITPDLKIDKVIDTGVRKILEERLKEFGGNTKEAFSNLDKNPIWLNKEKGISIKRVTISGVKNAEALHHKKDHFGREILDENGKRIPVDFVSTGNNHHVAIYRDADGNLQENVISFFEAVERANQGIPVIDKAFNAHLCWKFLFTMKQNEYFVFPNEQSGFNPNEIDLLDKKNYKLISPNLFRVQKIATGDYWFRHHLETNVDVKLELKDVTYKRSSLSGIKYIVKVRLNHIGEIVKVGEY